MENYFTSRETLEQLVDTLLSQKFPNQDHNSAEYANLREDAIMRLDDQISTDLFSRLTRPQLAELNQIFDNNEENPEVFRDFFARAGLNVTQIIAATVESFKNEFLGGQNA